VNNGPLGYYDGSAHFTTLDQPPSPFAGLNISRLFEAKDGWLWVGTTSGTARWWQSQTNGTSFHEPIRAVRAIHEDARHRIWLGTAEQGLFYFEDGTYHEFPDATLRRETIFAVATDRQERLWIGTQWGLRVYDADLQPVNVLSITTEVRALFVDPHNDVWIGTSGEGVARFQKGRVTHLTQTNGLANDFVTTLLEDREGGLWIGTREGLSQLSLATSSSPSFRNLKGSPARGRTGFARRRTGACGWPVTAVSPISWVLTCETTRSSPDLTLPM
jgi:ligand-binding sensor domain-containing protein